MAKILDGKETAAILRGQISTEVQRLQAEYGVQPGLAVIIVGEDPASKVYVGRKHKACEDVGVYSEVIRMAETSTEEELLAQLDSLNNNSKINGILVQLPLPKHINSERVLNAIRPDKDVDGFHPLNVGALGIGVEGLVPCTPHGVVKMLEIYDIPVSGKRAVIIGRSNIVGKPNFVTADMVKPGAVVIDVGINRMADNKLVGDVDFEAVKEVAGAITPVPGGVGPLTIVMLLFNTVKATEMQITNNK